MVVDSAGRKKMDVLNLNALLMRGPFVASWIAGGGSIAVGDSEGRVVPVRLDGQYREIFRSSDKDPVSMLDWRMGRLRVAQGARRVTILNMKK